MVASTHINNGELLRHIFKSLLASFSIMYLMLIVLFIASIQICVNAHHVPYEVRQLSTAACAIGSRFLVCNDGRAGCFAQHPCASRQCKPACPDDAKTATIFEPTMYDLIPTQPNVSTTPVSYIHLRNQASQPILNQAFVFRDIPEAAKTCTFRWAQAAEGERNFTVEGSGLVLVTSLNGFPPDENSISAPSIVPYLSTPQFNVDFTGWDQIRPASTHIGSVLNCSEVLAFSAALNRLNGDGDVYMEQDRMNGFYIEYSC